MSAGREPEQNLQKALERVSDAAGRGAQVVCLPELFQTQYFCQRRRPLPVRPGRTHPRPHQREAPPPPASTGSVLIASLFEKRAPGIYHNTAAIFDSNGTLSGLYRKMHIPDDPLYYEKFYFTPGDLGFHALDTTSAASALSSAGTNGIPKAPASPRCKARPSSSSNRHRMASLRERRVRHRPARRLAYHPARPRHRQRRLRSSGESCRLRNRQHPRQVHTRPRTGILGDRFSAIPSAES